MKSKKITNLLTPIAFATAQLFAFKAYAADTQLPEVEVVANTVLTGVGVPLTDVPSNAQVIKKKDIVDQGTNNLADLLNNNLGSVSVSNGTGNGYQNDVNYRGFSATSLLGAPVGLSVYFDGVRMNEPFGSNVNWDLIPMNAISSINLLPGSNPMFGLNTLGGALVVNTKNGKDDSGTAISLLGGSFNRRVLSFETGWADDAHNTDYFISGNYDKQDGYRWYSNSTVQQLYGKARWRDADTKAELSFALADNTLNGTQSLPPEMLGTPKAAYTYPDSMNNKMALLNLKFSKTLSDGDLLSGNLYYRKSNSSSVNSNAEQDDGCIGKPCTLMSPNGVGGWASLTPYKTTAGTGTTVVSGTTTSDGNKLLAGYSKFYFPIYAFTAPGTTSGVSYGSFTAQTLSAAQTALQAATGNTDDYGGLINTTMVYSATYQDTVGTNLMWTNTDDKLFGHANTFSLGTSLDHAHISYNQNTYLARLINYQNVPIYTDKANSTVNGASGLVNSVNVGSNNDSLSVFMTDTLDVTDRLKLTASGSFNVTRITLGGANNDYLNSDGGSLASGASWVGSTKLINPSVTGLNGTHQYSRFNPSFGFSYLPTKNFNLFGGYSEAMRAPTAIELSCADPAHPCNLPTGFNGDPDLKAVTAKTYELGVRGLMSANAAWNLAVYDTKLSNDIQFIFNSSTTGNFANVGDTERRGLDAGVSGKYDKLFLAANYGYVDAKYITSWQNSAGDTIVNGNKIPGVANQTVKLRIAYEVSPELLLGSNLIFVAGQYAHGDETNQSPKVPGYGVMNLDLHYKVSDDLMLNGVVNNLLNKQYFTYGVTGTNIYTGNSGTFVTPAATRSFWVGLTYTFGGKRLNTVDKD